MSEPSLRERVARAAFEAFQHDVMPGGRVAWEQVPETHSTWYEIADAVLAVVREALPSHDSIVREIESVVESRSVECAADEVECLLLEWLS